jgi:hypothetical protein
MRDVTFKGEALAENIGHALTLHWPQKLVFTEAPSRKSEKGTSDGSRRFGASGVELFQISALAS